MCMKVHIKCYIVSSYSWSLAPELAKCIYSCCLNVALACLTDRIVLNTLGGTCENKLSNAGIIFFVLINFPVTVFTRVGEAGLVPPLTFCVSELIRGNLHMLQWR